MYIRVQWIIHFYPLSYRTFLIWSLVNFERFEHLSLAWIRILQWDPPEKKSFWMSYKHAPLDPLLLFQTAMNGEWLFLAPEIVRERESPSHSLHSSLYLWFIVVALSGAIVVVWDLLYWQCRSYWMELHCSVQVLQGLLSLKILAHNGIFSKTGSISTP